MQSGLGIGPGMEVVVPDFTFPASAHAVALAGAVPVLVDVDPSTMLVDYQAMELAITDKTAALMPVSLFGNPLDWERLEAMAHRKGVLLLEDAACGLGATMHGAPSGSFGAAAVFSLHARKSVAAGEGGCIVSNNLEFLERAASYKRFGSVAREGLLRFESPGTNAKLSDVLAALGVMQLQRFADILARRRELAARYDQLLAGLHGVVLPCTTPGGVNAWQSYVLRLTTPPAPKTRDSVLQAMRAAGVEVQIGTYCLHVQPVYASGRLGRMHGALSGARAAFEQSLALPLFPDMTDAQQQRVAETLADVLRLHSSF